VLAFTPDGTALIAAGNRVKEIDGKKILLPSVAFFSAGDPTIRGETSVFRAEPACDARLLETAVQ
jgi:hypothetical protein